jgi:hypothetical protein
VPLKLSIDNSSASEIEVGSDGVWSIIGGKVREIFYVACFLVVMYCMHQFFFFFLKWNHIWSDSLCFPFTLFFMVYTLVYLLRCI